MYLLLKFMIFLCHVSLLEGTSCLQSQNHINIPCWIMSLAAQQKVSWKVRIVIFPSKTWRSRKCVPRNQDLGDGRRPRGLLHMKHTNMYNLLMMPMYSTHDACINCCKTYVYTVYIISSSTFTRFTTCTISCQNTCHIAMKSFSFTTKAMKQFPKIWVQLSWRSWELCVWKRENFTL